MKTPCLSVGTIPEWESFQFAGCTGAAACLDEANFLALIHNLEAAQRFYREAAAACQ